MPTTEKEEVIKKLRQRGKSVATVGNGVNEAPTMAKSTVGIAVGAAGSDDVALETVKLL